jgi:hypothetical protein
MNRREFITLLGGAAVVWPLATRAQQPTPIVGLINSRSAQDAVRNVAAFRKGVILAWPVSDSPDTGKANPRGSGDSWKARYAQNRCSVWRQS